MQFPDKKFILNASRNPAHFGEWICGLRIYMWAQKITNVSRRSHTRVGTLIVATIYLQLIQKRYMFRSFTVLQFSHQHCVQPVASDVEVVGYL